MAGERVALEHEVERLVQTLLGHLPGDQRALREVRREERLADAAYRPRCEQCPHAFDYGFDGDAGAARDLAEGVSLEALELVLGDGEDGGVYGVIEGKG